MNNKHEIRDAIPEDMPFIFNAWQKNGSQGMTFEERGDLFSFIKKVLSDSSTLVKVCCDTENKSFIMGFIVFSGDNYYHYVKKSFRGLGIINHLINSKKG